MYAKYRVNWALCAPNELLWLNAIGAEVSKQGKKLPPHSIVSGRLTGR
jgi:hypothetical protein